jgi:hypothetical protein
MRIANERTPDNPREKLGNGRKKGESTHGARPESIYIKSGLWGYEEEEKMIRNEGNQKLCPPTQRSNQIRKIAQP